MGKVSRMKQLMNAFIFAINIQIHMSLFIWK